MKIPILIHTAAPTMEIESTLSKEIQQVLDDTAQNLSKPRKKKIKALTAEVVAPEKITSFSSTNAHTFKAGITCLDLDPTHDSVVRVAFLMQIAGCCGSIIVRRKWAAIEWTTLGSE